MEEKAIDHHQLLKMLKEKGAQYVYDDVDDEEEEDYDNGDGEEDEEDEEGTDHCECGEGVEWEGSEVCEMSCVRRELIGVCTRAHSFRPPSPPNAAELQYISYPAESW